MNELINNHVFLTLMALITSFSVTYIAIPSIIHIAKAKHLFDEPGARKSHTGSIPTLGGVAIFGGFIIALSIWSNMDKLPLIQYVLAASCLIFLVGAKDDIVDLSPRKKFIGQILATLILVIIGRLYFTSFHDLFPFMQQVPMWLGVIVSIFTILVITNAFNLIDGINGLSASQGIIISATFGVWFWLNQDYQMVILVVSLIGALLAFLRYNISPASIFMGDTGSLLIGLICAVMAIHFSEKNIDSSIPYHINAAPAVAIGFIALPLFDLLRAFSIRISRGKSPFNPDRNHLHHLLIDSGKTHMQATIILACFQAFNIALVLIMQRLVPNSWIIIIFLLAISIGIAYIFHKAKQKNKRLRKKK